MADNIQLNAGAGGQVLATDDIGGIQYQRVKATYGADGSATDVSATSPLPVAQPQVSQTIVISAGTGTRTHGTIDLLNCAQWAATVVTTGSVTGSAALQMSADGTTWTGLSTFEVYNASGNPSTTVSNSLASNISTLNQTLTAPVFMRYLRVQTSSTVTGTYTLVFTGYATPLQSLRAPTIQGQLTPTDPYTPASGHVPVQSVNYAYNGATYDLVRTPKVFKAVNFNSDTVTTVWTPAAGKKFRLMKYMIHCPGNVSLAGGGMAVFTLYDGASTALPFNHGIYLPGSAANQLAGWSTPWIDLGNGYLSFSANNILGVVSSAAITGFARLLVAGTEE